MTSFRDALLSEYTPARKQSTNTHSVPKGWEPSVSLDASGQGSIATGPVEDAPDWSEVLAVWNLDPEQFTVHNVQMRAWDTNMGGGVVRRMYYYKADIRGKVRPAGNDDDTIEDMAAIIDSLENVSVPNLPFVHLDSTYVVALADWQLGKLTEHAVNHIESSLITITAEVAQIRTYRPGLRRLVLLGLGDLIESCEGHYSTQTFTADLNLRDQLKLARRLITAYVKTLAPLFDETIVACVGGNHGENRRDGKILTDFADNHDVSVFEQVQEITNEIPALNHVRYIIPNGDLAVTFELHGKVIGIAHGHQTGKGGGTGMVGDKIWKWWKDQAHGRQPVGDADILFTGHNHHFFMVASGGRTLVGCPSAELESEWFRNLTGTGGMPATLTAMIDECGLTGVRLI